MAPRPEAKGALPLPLLPILADRTTVRVVQGPLLTPDFLTPAYLDTFYASEWEVHYNSSRTGIRLLGPKPEWVREDGGDAGFTPRTSTITRTPSAPSTSPAICPLSLAPTGPAWGALFAPAAVAEADRWKLGQLRPGDKLRFEPISLEQAQRLLDDPRPPSLRRSPAAGGKARRKWCCLRSSGPW